MKKLLLKVRMIRNKANGQINFSIPKKKLDVSVRDKINKAKSAFIRLEDFK